MDNGCCLDVNDLSSYIFKDTFGTYVVPANSDLCTITEVTENNMEVNKMDQVIKRANDILYGYKNYIDKYFGKKTENEIDELIKKSKAYEIVDKHIKMINDEIRESINGNLFWNIYSIELNHQIIELKLTKEEKKIEKEIKDKNNKLRIKANEKIDNIIKSLDLCETRDQVMDLLHKTGFVDDNGVIKYPTEVQGYLGESISA